MVAKQELIEMIQSKHNEKITTNILKGIKDGEDGQTIPNDEAMKYLREKIRNRAG